MQKQWAAAKERAKDAILLFRMGDFYELFAEDANLAAPILELTLTSRDRDIPMAGFPHHAAPAYIAKLVALGYKVAICDQLEDPKLAKGIVKRDITRIVTPGTVLEDDSLRPSSNNYLLALVASGHQYTLSAIDLSTGDFLETKTPNAQSLLDEVGKWLPSEILIGGTHWSKPLLNQLKQVANQTKSCRFEFISEATSASQLILQYISETQGARFSCLGAPKAYSIESELIIDAVSREHLDLPGLFHLLNKTCTAMGARLLRRWLNAPSTHLPEIQRRFDGVENLLHQASRRQSVREILRHLYDLERLTVKISVNRATPRELANVRDSLARLPQISEVSDPMPDLFELLDRSLADNPPMLLKEGGVFQAGYDALLDDYVGYASGGRDQIAAIEQRERERTGISSLKVKFTRVFGYYIEITNTHLAKVPEGYKRKQTVANGERYVTEELMRLEERVSTAEVRRLARETELFETLRAQMNQHAARLFQAAAQVAELDTLCALAECADEYRYVRPTILEKELNRLDIQEGRHPIIESLHQKKGLSFVPNSMQMNRHDRQLLLLTGPNMAGKSTMMRQVALIQLMSQMGSFVPASSAELSLCDRIFTRVGASDDSRTGRSTFMVEMSETAHILKHATSYSLVLLDEIGRGTSTFDGLSIAFAVAEYLHNEIRARTLFATHYHELTQLSETLSHMRNLQVAVSEQNGEIKFLYTLLEGAAGQSYGIQVARLAGLPKPVLDRANEVLKSLEQGKATPQVKRPPKEQLGLFVDPIRSTLKAIDLNQITPIQALQTLIELKSSL
ncbi:MAG: DNA mismatch repair protein MutS [Myxococcaceae bacterium]|nr:DNA mismatch repair protein MutS [Myxococcaceae bacterium]MBH2005756.1 DNA mismatch repair protein MutS [Myxococcaceae bacterium]